MATVRKGVLVVTKEWCVHLRRYGKAAFWRKHRKAEKGLVRSLGQ